MTKQEQLGMNPSTASHRLIRDLLWDLIVQTKQDICCKCNKQMDRETFSIEHIIPWLHSKNPIELYFDLNNISFSHLLCNIKSRRSEKKPYKHHTEEDRIEAVRASKRKHWTPQKRKEYYLKTGR